MAVFKSEADLLSDGGALLGTGTAVLHIPHGVERAQDATGTLSLKTWTPSEDLPAAIRLPDRRRLPISVSRDALSECSRNRVLRYRTHWPPEPAAEP